MRQDSLSKAKQGLSFCAASRNDLAGGRGFAVSKDFNAVSKGLYPVSDDL